MPADDTTSTHTTPRQPGTQGIDPLPEPGQHAPDRNLALELVRVTEAAAMGAARCVGRGDKDGADGRGRSHAATDQFSVDGGAVVIGEGEKTRRRCSSTARRSGTGASPPVDVAVDPVEGTPLRANGMPNAVAVLAVSARGTMYDPAAVLLYGEAAHRPAGRRHGRYRCAARGDHRRRGPGGSFADVVVVILDRPRHEQVIGEVRDAGARVRLITDGDVAAATVTARRAPGST